MFLKKFLSIDVSVHGPSSAPNKTSANLLKRFNNNSLIIRCKMSLYSIISELFVLINFFSAPVSAPEGLTSKSIEKRSLSVVWVTVPCPGQRGPITGYRLRYSSSTVVITGEGNREQTLTGLTPFTSYSVQVAAANAGGTGPYSTALTVETLQDGE